MAKGVRQSIEEMKQAGLDPTFLLFFMWSEAIKHFAEEGKGNVIFLDGSVEGMQRQLREVTALGQLGKLGMAPSVGPNTPTAR
jgi:prepilin-type processing-associated H-X9-DG protein